MGEGEAAAKVRMDNREVESHILNVRCLKVWRLSD